MAGWGPLSEHNERIASADNPPPMPDMSSHQWRKFARAQRNMIRFFKSARCNKKNARRATKWARVVDSYFKKLLPDFPF
jgi:hypothetical protein